MADTVLARQFPTVPLADEIRADCGLPLAINLGAFSKVTIGGTLFQIVNENDEPFYGQDDSIETCYIKTQIGNLPVRIESKGFNQFKVISIGNDQLAYDVTSAGLQVILPASKTHQACRVDLEPRANAKGEYFILAGSDLDEQRPKAIGFAKAVPVFIGEMSARGQSAHVASENKIIDRATGVPVDYDHSLTECYPAAMLSKLLVEHLEFYGLRKPKVSLLQRWKDSAGQASDFTKQSLNDGVKRLRRGLSSMFASVSNAAAPLRYSVFGAIAAVSIASSAGDNAANDAGADLVAAGANRVSEVSEVLASPVMPAASEVARMANPQANGSRAEGCEAQCIGALQETWQVSANIAVDHVRSVSMNLRAQAAAWLDQAQAGDQIAATNLAQGMIMGMYSFDNSDPETVALGHALLGQIDRADAELIQAYAQYHGIGMEQDQAAAMDVVLTYLGDPMLNVVWPQARTLVGNYTAPAAEL